jgi:hypothetical protein
MTTEYSPEKQLIKDFIHWASENHKCALVAFPDEFAAQQYVNYMFVDNGQLIEEFINEKVKVSKE